jgi:hypothetical protein
MQSLNLESIDNTTLLCLPRFGGNTTDGLSEVIRLWNELKSVVSRNYENRPSVNSTTHNHAVMGRSRSWPMSAIKCF